MIKSVKRIGQEEINYEVQENRQRHNVGGDGTDSLRRCEILIA